jgi:hypothetical protein
MSQSCRRRVHEVVAGGWERGGASRTRRAGRTQEGPTTLLATRLNGLSGGRQARRATCRAGVWWATEVREWRARRSGCAEAGERPVTGPAKGQPAPELPLSPLRTGGPSSSKQPLHRATAPAPAPIERPDTDTGARLASFDARVSTNLSPTEYAVGCRVLCILQYAPASAAACPCSYIALLVSP